mgnify:CR=1 FL=1|jgi:preprotein translocase subunit SecE
MNALMNYFKDVRSEMRHVSWPTRNQAITYTVVVLGVSVVTALYLGAWDYLFSALIQKVI